MPLSTDVSIPFEYGWLRFNTPNDLLNPIFEGFTSPPPGDYELEDTKFEFDMDMQASSTDGYVSGFSHVSPFWETALKISIDGGPATLMGGTGGEVPGFPWCLAKDGVHAYAETFRGRFAVAVVGDDLFSNGTVFFNYTSLGITVSNFFVSCLATDHTTGHLMVFAFRDDPVLNQGYFIDEIDPVAGALVHSVQMYDNITRTGFGGTTASS